MKSSVHYSLVDGGALTAPDNAVFDPINNVYVGENEGIAPDIAVRQDAKSLSQGKDPQLERAVQEALRLLQTQEVKLKPEPEAPAMPGGGGMPGMGGMGGMGGMPGMGGMGMM